MSSVHTKRKSLLTLFWFWYREIHRKYSKPWTKTQTHQNTSFDDEESTEMARFFLELHHCMVERNNFTFCSMIPPPPSHCKLTAWWWDWGFMASWAVGETLDMMDGGQPAAPARAQRRRGEVFGPLSVMQGALAWWASPALPHLSHTWLSSSLYACTAIQRHDR